MALFCRISETKQDIGQKSRFFIPLLHSTASLRASPSECCHIVWCGKKLEWCDFPTVKKKFEDCINVSTEYWHVTDKQTDRHLATAQFALCTASRGKNWTEGENLWHCLHCHTVWICIEFGRREQHISHCYTSSSTVTERSRDALCPSVVSFNSVIPRASLLLLLILRLQIYHCVQLNAVLLSSA